MNRKDKLDSAFAVRIKIKARHLDRSRAASSRGAVERPLYFAVAVACPPRPNPKSVILSEGAAESKDLRLSLSLQSPSEAA
jgi:hypothetical protein